MFPQEYTNKQWCDCWKGANINLNINMQQSAKIQKSSICLKRQETSLHQVNTEKKQAQKSISIFHANTHVLCTQMLKIMKYLQTI